MIHGMPGNAPWGPFMVNIGLAVDIDKQGVWDAISSYNQTGNSFTNRITFVC